MIVAERKPIRELKGFIEEYNRVLVLGCGTCVTVCFAGGETEVRTLSSALRIANLKEQKGQEIIEDVVTRQCEPEFLEKVTERVRDESIDAVLSLGCGVGVNMLAEKLDDVPVFPGLNTECFGATAEPGTFVEMCAGCGECVLHLTGGICPIARCSKSILNGPCGGTNDGKCEVSPDIDCAWALIVERMKKLGTIDQLYKVVDAKDWSTSHSGGPRRVVNDIPRPIASSDEEEPR